MPKYTEKQQQAIDTRGSNLLVAAAAGSGKTAVLVERIIQVILDENKPVDIDRLLVVTFTEAAASEMRQRIASAINARLDVNPFNEHLRRQSILISKAPISTIHAFCNNVVRKNFHLLGVDPAYRIGDTTEISLLQEGILNDLFADYYDENNPVFFDIIEIFSDRFSDERLKSLVLKLYEFSQNSPEPDNWLIEHREEFHISEGTSVENTTWGKIIIRSIKDKLEGALFSATEGLKFCSMPYGPEKYANNLLDDQYIINLLITKCNEGYNSLYKEIAETNFSRLAAISAKDNVDERLKATVKTIREKEIKAVVKGIKDKYFFKSPENIISDIKAIYPYIYMLTELVIEFRKRFSSTKLEKNVLDFNDLEHFCLKVLIESPDTAQQLSDKFDEVYTDEYQDSNMVQELILSKVSKHNNRFMVGDVKQSIYKFRRANPEIFMNKYEYYDDTGENIKVDLSKNFRSRAGVLDGINFIFAQLMTRQIGGVMYAPNEQLNYGADYPDFETNLTDSVELLLAESLSDDNQQTQDDIDDITEDITKEELETTLIAYKINKLLHGEKPAQIFDRSGGGYRKASYGDIVILLRSMSGAQTLVQGLTRYGIPCFANTSSGYFHNIEVMTVLSLLNVIDNPLQDIHLITVLHSPIYNISADGLCEIRNADKKSDFFNALTKYSEDNYSGTQNKNEATLKSVKKILADLQRWRKAKIHSSVSALISKLYDETSYFDYLGAMPQGNIRQANLRALFEHSVKFEQTSLRGLFRFIKYTEKLMERDTGMKDAQVIAENENVVRIMTIHKSKGLEFPICFVSNLGKKFNRLDEHAELILHQEYGFGPKYTDLDLRIKSDTIARCALNEQVHMENYSEDIRVLYVALTRAKEKLILTGCVKDFYKSMEKWGRYTNLEHLKLPAHYILGCETALDWVGTAAFRHRDADHITDEMGLRSGYNELYNHNSKWDIECYSKKEIQTLQVGSADTYCMNEEVKQETQISKLDEKTYALIHDKFTWQYGNIEATHTPSKISISEMKRNYYSQKRFDAVANDFMYLKPVFNTPGFLAGERELTPAEKGTAIHTLMEHLDVTIHRSKQSIEKLAQTLVTKNLLTRQQLESLPIDKILKFSQSDLAERMRKATFLKKEAPFVMEIDAKEAFFDENRSGSVLVHGIIDCYFIENNKLILVDFKSDYVRNQDGSEIASRYKIQMGVYKKTLERSMNMDVAQCLLYLFDIGNTVNVMI